MVIKRNIDDTTFFFIAGIISGFKIENMGNEFKGFEMDRNTFKKRGTRGRDRMLVG